MCKLNLAGIKNFFFHNHPPLYAHYSLISSQALLITRIIAVLYLTGFYIYDISQSQTLLTKIIYLTDVGYFFTLLYFVVIVQSRFIKSVQGLDHAAELLFQTIFCTEVFVTIAYWSVIYQFDTEPSMFKNVNWHGVPVFFLTIDFVFNSFRFILKQYVGFLILGGVYMFCINMPYSLIIQPVYGQATDWVGWLTYVFILAAVIVTGLIYLACRIIYTKCKAKKLFHRNILTDIQQTENKQKLTQDENIKQDHKMSNKKSKQIQMMIYQAYI